MRIEDLIDIAQLVREAALASIRSGRAGEIVGHGLGGDLTKRIDRIAEEVILKEIKKRGFGVTLVSEELGVMSVNGGGPFLVVDPIDGTTNAIRGIPVFSTSIALSEGKYFEDICLGLVMNLATGDVFYAEKGCGAYLNERSIRPSSIRRLTDALVELDLNIRRKYVRYLKRITPILINAKHIRFLGSDALALCLVAHGASDAFIDLRGILRVTDMAAGAFIAKESGAVLYSDKAPGFNVRLDVISRSSIIVACTSDLLEDILSTISLK